MSLLMYFAFWYLGNSFYNIQNKRALNATGGKTAGFGMTVATLQLAVGAVYSFFIWIIGYNFLPCCGFVAPTKQSPPKISFRDFLAMIPVAFCSAAVRSDRRGQTQSCCGGSVAGLPLFPQGTDAVLLWCCC